MSTSFLDALKKALGFEKKTPAPEQPKKPRAVDYLKAWKLFQLVPIEKLGSVAFLSAVLVFFAVSGALAWLAIFVRFFLFFARGAS